MKKEAKQSLPTLIVGRFLVGAEWWEGGGGGLLACNATKRWKMRSDLGTSSLLLLHPSNHQCSKIYHICTAFIFCVRATLNSYLQKSPWNLVRLAVQICEIGSCSGWGKSSWPLSHQSISFFSKQKKSIESLLERASRSQAVVLISGRNAGYKRNNEWPYSPVNLYDAKWIGEGMHPHNICMKFHPID